MDIFSAMARFLVAMQFSKFLRNNKVKDEYFFWDFFFILLFPDRKTIFASALKKPDEAKKSKTIIKIIDWR